MEEAREEDGEAHIGGMLRSMASSPKIFSMSSGRSGKEFFRRVAALAEGLRGVIQCGDRVAIAALTSESFVEWMMAVTCAGGIVAPLNYRWSFEEAKAAIQIVRPVIFVSDGQCQNWCDRLKNLYPWMLQVSIEDPSHVIRGETTMHRFQEDDTYNLDLCFAPRNIALICFTSGTTGTPKGVSLTHRALIMQSIAKLDIVGYSSTDSYLHTAPLCHIGGISSALAMIMAGSQQFFLPKFETGAVLRTLRNYNISTMIVVPTMLRDIVETANSVFPGMQTILNGGGSIPSHLLPAVRKIFPNARIFSAYGMTEACSSMTFLQLRDSIPLGDGVCVGVPSRFVQLEIRSGRVFTRGPHVMDGYWGQIDETATVLHRDGWFDTGDIGRVDEDGKLWLLGRAKDVVKTGGENVYASEVEIVLSQHPAVSSVAVVGVPDARLSETVAAVVRLNQGWTWSKHGTDDVEEEGGKQHPMTVSKTDLQLHCGEHGLSRYKIPKTIVQQRDPFPVTSTGKIKKSVIKEILSKL